MAFREKSCPKCKGDIWLDCDEYGWYEQCTVCDYLCSLEGIKYINGMESIVVSRQDGPKIYSINSMIETFKKTMKVKVQEARFYILTELSKGALEKRQLRSILRGEGVFKYAFDIALKELSDTGKVISTKDNDEDNKKKLTLVT